MNYEKGFRRLFAVAAVCWFGFWLLVGLNERVSDTIIIFVVAVPALAYVLLFKVVPWVGKGFK